MSTSPLSVTNDENKQPLNDDGTPKTMQQEIGRLNEIILAKDETIEKLQALVDKFTTDIRKLGERIEHFEKENKTLKEKLQQQNGSSSSDTPSDSNSPPTKKMKK